MALSDPCMGSIPITEIYPGEISCMISERVNAYSPKEPDCWETTAGSCCGDMTEQLSMTSSQQHITSPSVKMNPLCKVQLWEIEGNPHGCPQETADSILPNLYCLSIPIESRKIMQYGIAVCTFPEEKKIVTSSSIQLAPSTSSTSKRLISTPLSSRPMKTSKAGPMMRKNSSRSSTITDWYETPGVESSWMMQEGYSMLVQKTQYSNWYSAQLQMTSSVQFCLSVPLVVIQNMGRVKSTIQNVPFSAYSTRFSLPQQMISPWREVFAKILPFQKMARQTVLLSSDSMKRVVAQLKMEMMLPGKVRFSSYGYSVRISQIQENYSIDSMPHPRSMTIYSQFCSFRYDWHMRDVRLALQKKQDPPPCVNRTTSQSQDLVAGGTVTLGTCGKSKQGLLVIFQIAVPLRKERLLQMYGCVWLSMDQTKISVVLGHTPIKLFPPAQVIQIHLPPLLHSRTMNCISAPRAKLCCVTMLGMRVFPVQLQAGSAKLKTISPKREKEVRMTCLCMKLLAREELQRRTCVQVPSRRRESALTIIRIPSAITPQNETSPVTVTAEQMAGGSRRVQSMRQGWMEAFLGQRQSEERGMQAKKVSLLCWMEMFCAMASTGSPEQGMVWRKQERSSQGNSMLVSDGSNIIYVRKGTQNQGENWLIVYWLISNSVTEQKRDQPYPYSMKMIESTQEMPAFLDKRWIIFLLYLLVQAP